MSDLCINHIENHWKKLTISSNDYFNKNEFTKALEGYKEALYRAEVLNNHQSQCGKLAVPFMQVYIISCNNLSNTYLEINNLEEAENMLKRVVYYLLHLSNQKAINLEEVQSELKRASLSLLEFCENNNLSRKKEALLDSIKSNL